MAPYRGYFAIVLSPESEQALAAAFATLSKRFSHHMTVVFGTDSPTDLPAAFSADDLGNEVTLKVIGFRTRADNGIQAVAVALVRNGSTVVEGISANAVPHITVALDPSLAKPVDSNALLMDGFEQMDGMELTGVLQHIR